MAEFVSNREFRDEPDWIYGGVNWLEVFKNYYKDEGAELSAVSLRNEEGYFPVNPETTRIFISAANDNMDCIIYTDQEDGKSWTWFREECKGEFQHIIESIGHLACTVATPVPLKGVVQMFEEKEDAKLQRELDSLDEFGL